jgi:hypothetical protein
LDYLVREHLVQEHVVYSHLLQTAVLKFLLGAKRVLLALVYWHERIRHCYRHYIFWHVLEAGLFNVDFSNLIHVHFLSDNLVVQSGKVHKDTLHNVSHANVTWFDVEIRAYDDRYIREFIELESKVLMKLHHLPPLLSFFVGFGKHVDLGFRKY